MTIVRKKEITEISISADWIVEIDESEKTGTIEFWLGHKDYAIKELIFGIPIYRREQRNVAEMIANIDQLVKPYQEIYIKNYFESEEI